MQIIIDIPEDLYKATINGLNAEEIWDLRVAIKSGTLLPKEHEDLIDGDKIMKIRGIKSIPAVLNAPIIIESDKESKDADSN